MASSSLRSHRRSVLGRAVLAVGLSAGLLTAGWEAGTVPAVAALVTGTPDPVGTAGDGSGQDIALTSAAAPTGSAASAPTGSAASAPTSASTSVSTPTASSGASSTTAATGTAQTYTGDAVATRYGTVQVQATVQDGTLTAVDVLQWTDFGRYVQRVKAVLPDEVLSAQSADVHAVSGATYTSEGYLESLQSALDQANA